MPSQSISIRLTSALLLTAALATSCSRSHAPVTRTDPSDLSATVATVRARYRLPALAVSVFDLERSHLAVSGVRKQGSLNPVQPTDLFHVGSLTKGVTATAIGRLVEQGALRWSLTLAEAFPEMGDSLQPGLRTVTLAQLLQHRSGIAGFTALEDFSTLPEFPGDATAQRLAFAHFMLAQPPATPVGEYSYSNAGYGIAGAIAERATGESWEQLVRSRVLDPLGIHAFVGWPLEYSPAQPWGHYEDETGSLVPAAPELGHVPAIVAPAGDLSFTLGDLTRYGQMHLRAESGVPELLAESTFTRLHTPNGDYAMGWVEQTLGGRRILWHNGSAGTFYAFLVLDPSRQKGCVLFTNAESAGADSAFAEILTSQGVLGSAAAARLLRPAERHRPGAVERLGVVVEVESIRERGRVAQSHTQSARLER